MRGFGWARMGGGADGIGEGTGGIFDRFDRGRGEFDKHATSG